MAIEGSVRQIVWNILPRDGTLRLMLLDAVFADFFGTFDCAKFIDDYDWPMSVHTAIVVSALER